MRDRTLNTYRQAMLAAFPGIPDADLSKVLDNAGPEFATFVIDHGLGPIWYERTGAEIFHRSRLAGEALYLAQERALLDIDAALVRASVNYAVIKGGANRILLYPSPAVRACLDLDILVAPADRVACASILCRLGFAPRKGVLNISHQLVLTRNAIDVDLHWGLLRDGRLRIDIAKDMVARRQRTGDINMLSAEDSLFLLLVHPAFTKHLDGWATGLHRVVDLLRFVQLQTFDWDVVRRRLDVCGVRAAAWATLYWALLLAGRCAPPELDTYCADLGIGRLRRAWLAGWLQRDLSSRLSRRRLTRLAGFSSFLHDSPADAGRAILGRFRAHRRKASDLAAFESIQVE